MRILPAFALAALLTACGSGEPVLHVYTSLDAQEAPVYLDAFTQATGIPVSVVRLSAGEALARLEAERGNPQVSVWFGGPSPEYIVAAERGLLEPYEPTLDHELDPAARGAQWEWTGFYSGVIGFACNHRMLAAYDVACPDSWQGLLDPAFSEQISLAYPYTSGTAFITVASLLAHLGEERGWQFIAQLDSQVHHYNSSGTAAVTQAGLGEVAVAIAFAHDILKKGIERGYPLTLSVPRDGAPAEIGAVAIVKGAPEPELAKRFVDWLHTREAQDLLAGWYRVPLHPDASLAEDAVLLRDVDIIELDAAAAAADQQRILERWRQVTGR